MVFGDASKYPIVDDDAVFVEHKPVSGVAWFKALSVVEINPLQELRSVRTPYLKFAERRAIEESYVVANSFYFAADEVEFVANAVNTDVGILVNDRLQSSQPDIYAAGDVAQGRDFSTGAYSVQAIQPTAADHARLAALNMAGQEAVHRGSVNMNVLDTLGLISSSFGLWMGVDGGSATELCDRDRYHYLNLQFQDDVLVGASSLGLTDHVGVLRGLIQSQVRLGAWKDRLLSDPTRVMEAYLASTQAVNVRAAVH